MLRRALFVFLFSWLATPAFSSSVSVVIDVSEQKMYVSVGSQSKFVWDVSTARKGYRTPIGKYKPTRMHKRYFSKKYNGSPMPHSIFFYGGYAIHGTNAIKNLGNPASHGCVRLHPDNAQKLFSLVKKHGSKKTSIRVRG